MRVLLDECLPKKLKREVQADVVKTVPEMGWAGAKNGSLLRLVEQEFDVFLTNDQRTAALAPWLDFYNNRRRHSAIGGLPPISRLS